MTSKRVKFNDGNWTIGRYHAFVTSVLRAGSRKWPPKYITLNSAKTEKRINPASKRLAQHYRCNACKQEYTSAQVQVDHKKPVVNPKLGFTTWDDYINALFCEKNNLQVLCKTCHAIKTKEEKSSVTKEKLSTSKKPSKRKTAE